MARPAEPAGAARCRPALGTYVEIQARDGDRPLAAIDSAFDAIAAVQRRMSFHDDASDLSRLNAAAAGDDLALHPWTVAVLRFAHALHAASGGAFDPGAGAGSSIASVEILDDTRVRLHAPVRLDLGGVAKGFAVDCAIDALVAHGVTQATVNAGGDLRVLGDPRPVHLRRPDAPASLHALGELGDGAIATSAAYFSPGALVDPRTGESLATRRSFSVIAPTCMVADGLTKVLAVTGALPEDCARRWDAQAVVL